MKITITYDSLEEMLAHTIIPGYQPTGEIDPPAGLPLQSGKDIRAAVPNPTPKPAQAPNPAFQTAPSPKPGILDTPEAKAMHEAAKAITEAAQKRSDGIIIEQPKTNPQAAADFSEALPPIDEDYRISVRKELAKLNKLIGANVAKDLIKSTAGVERLTEVPLDKLEALMQAAKAKEAEQASKQ